MKVITMESSAYKEMMAQIANIAGYIRESRDEKKRKRETEDKLLDTEAAATAFPRYCGYWRTTQ